MAVTFAVGNFIVDYLSSLLVHINSAVIASLLRWFFNSLEVTVFFSFVFFFIQYLWSKGTVKIKATTNQFPSKQSSFVTTKLSNHEETDYKEIDQEEINQEVREEKANQEAKAIEQSSTSSSRKNLTEDSIDKDYDLSFDYDAQQTTPAPKQAEYEFKLDGKASSKLERDLQLEMQAQNLDQDYQILKSRYTQS